MTTTNYTPITEAQINASLGRDTFYGDPDKFYIHCDHKGVLSIIGDVISMQEAFELIATDKVWGMNDWAEDAIKVALDAQEAVLSESSTQSVVNNNAPIVRPTAFNLRNLQNLVADGSIFYVEFIKRSTGTLRKMKCRTGVKKHLRGGSKGYSAKAKDLLTVFDMQAGYRSIPIEAIERLTIGGQSFNFVGV